MIPYSMSVINTEKTDSMEFHAKKHLSRLSRHYGDIERCNMTIHMENSHEHGGKVFNVSLMFIIPGKKSVNVSKIDENIYIAIWEAFEAAERMIGKMNHKRKKSIKDVQHYPDKLAGVLC